MENIVAHEGKEQRIVPTGMAVRDNEIKLFFVKHFSLKKAFKFPFFIQGNSLLSAGTDYASWRIRACSIR